MQPLHEFVLDDHLDILDEGTFLTPKKGETVKASLIIATGILVMAAAFFGLRWFIYTGNDSDTALTRGNGTVHAFFDMSIHFVFLGSLILAEIVIFLATAVCVRFAAKGEVMSYTATSEVFSFEYGGKRRIYRYDEVSGVFFEPLTILGKVRGYNVTICGKTGAQEVKVIFARRGERSPDMTPFWLLHIRAAQIRASNAQAAPPEPKRPKYWHA